MQFRFKIELAERQGFDVAALRDLAVSHDDTELVIEQDDPRWLAVLTARRAKTKPAWVPSQRSRGLGDTIAKLTSAIGIKPCGGCGKRRATLNKILPYKK